MVCATAARGRAGVAFTYSNHILSLLAPAIFRDGISAGAIGVLSMSPLNVDHDWGPLNESSQC